MESLGKYIPILRLFQNYQKEWLVDDIMAGVTVGIMLIPQGMAYAMIAGLPPVYGLYTALIPVIIYSILGTSRKLAIGPVAIDSLIVATAVSAFASEGTDEFIATALLLTFLVGSIQIVMGALKMGFLVNFLSRPVIVGFTAAAAIIIGLNQFKYLFGVEVDRNAQMHLLAKDLFDNISAIHWLTFGVGILAIAIMIGLRMWSKRIPVALVIVGAGTACAYFLDFEGLGISVVGEIPAGLPGFGVPDISVESVTKLLPAAIALSVIGFMEAMSISKAIDESTENHKVRPNQELFALGVSNFVGSFFSSMVVTAGFSRTAVNVDSGAKSSLSRLVGVLIILLTLFFLSGVFYFLPEVFLASIIIVAVIKLIDIKSPASWWKMEKREFLMYAATLLTTMFVGIQEGILTGIALSLLLLIYRSTVPHMAEIALLPGEKKIYRNVKRFDNVMVDPEVLIVRFDERLYYANVDYFRNKLEEFESRRKEPLKTIIIDGAGINSIDITSINEVKKMIFSYKNRGVEVLFAGLKGPVRDSFRKYRIFKTTGQDHFFVDVENAMKYAKGKDFESKDGIAMQSNHEG